jgi:hypothetical protein
MIDKIRALRQYFIDLVNGDPVALGLTLLFGGMAAIVLTVFIVDRVKKHKEKNRKAAKAKGAKRPAPSKKI